jgi:predicted RNase H-like nuclease (RuvC/YqgF family)
MHDEKWELAKVRGENDKLKRENAELKSRIAAVTKLHNALREKLEAMRKGLRQHGEAKTVTKT